MVDSVQGPRHAQHQAHPNSLDGRTAAAIETERQGLCTMTTTNDTRADDIGEARKGTLTKGVKPLNARLERMAEDGEGSVDSHREHHKTTSDTKIGTLRGEVFATLKKNGPLVISLTELIQKMKTQSHPDACDLFSLEMEPGFSVESADIMLAPEKKIEAWLKNLLTLEDKGRSKI